MLPTTTERVSRNTPERVNQCIRRQTERNIAHFAAAGSEAIEQRLRELDHEWDVERYIETEAPLTILLGLMLANGVSRKWLLVPLLASSMVLFHNLQGWYPLLPLFRRLGIRSQAEIDEERYALKALRGDFRQVRVESDTGSQAHPAFEVAQPSRS